MPPDTPPGTAYLRLKSTVPTRGQFRLQATDRLEEPVPEAILADDGVFSVVALLAVLYALGRAWRLRSRAYGRYALLGLCIGVAGMFISGYGETWIWPGLADWRGPIASTMACVSAGLALLLAECAFALEVRAPRFALLLRVMGVLCPLAGVLGLAFSLSVHQMLSHVIATVATGLSLSSFWFAWHTENRAAGWLLAGFVPVSLGVGITTLGVAGIIPFKPWVLMAMPLGSALEVPFNLYGLHLLEQRRALVLQSQAELARVSARQAKTGRTCCGVSRGSEGRGQGRPPAC
ncbi:MAG: 7TM-DISM domain-containing protein [Comamonadaceae bacterium]|nr:7TM-DISM domain-containing protein [Comamonadaceae bacterium]